VKKLDISAFKAVHIRSVCCILAHF